MNSICLYCLIRTEEICKSVEQKKERVFEADELEKAFQ